MNRIRELFDKVYTDRYNEPMGNREKILDCALKLFALKGYASVGVQEIVNCAGISKPTLYHYFGNKEGLFTEILDSYFDDFFEHLSGQKLNTDLRISLIRVATVFFEFVHEEPDFFRLLISLDHAPLNSEAYKAGYFYLKKYFEMMHGYFTNSLNSAEKSPVFSEQDTLTLIGILHTYAIQLLNNQIRYEGRIIESVIDRFLYGVIER